MSRVKPTKSTKKSSSKSKSSIKAKKKKKQNVADEEKALKKKVKKSRVEEDEDELLDDDIDLVGDVEQDDEDDSEQEEPARSYDNSKIDAGPEVSEVPFGHNCASCALFVKWDDPRREDPAWLEKIESQGNKRRCPKLFGPDEFDTEDPQEVVAQASDPACTKYALNENNAPEGFITVLESVKREFGIPELEVLFAISEKLRKGKEMERNMGYRYGQSVNILHEDTPVKATVVDFRKKRGSEVVVRYDYKGSRYRKAIPAIRAVEIDE